MPSYYQRNKERIDKAQLDYYRRMGFNSAAEYQNHLRATARLKVIEILGGKCRRCGFSDIRALQVDHVNGDGYGSQKHKGSPSHWNNVLREIKSGSTRYQLLCANCNWIKRNENGEYK
jgi:hypothetical protein